MDDITARAYAQAKAMKALVVLTVDPDGRWTMLPISMELVEGLEDWHDEWLRQWKAFSNIPARK